MCWIYYNLQNVCFVTLDYHKLIKVVYFFFKVSNKKNEEAMLDDAKIIQKKRDKNRM